MLNERMFPWMSAIALPLTVAVVGHFVTRSIESARLDSEYVKLAVSVLTVPAQPEKSGVDQQREDLKRWAVDILNARSPVHLTASSAAGLQRLPALRLGPADPPPSSLTAECKPPDALKAGATSSELASWTSEWIRAYGCENSKRTALIQAWPR